MRLILIIAIVTLGFVESYSQANIDKLNYNRLNGIALSQDIRTILLELDTAIDLSDNDKEFKLKYENRFKYEYDRTDYFNKKDTTLNTINRIYQDYWRKSLLDNSKNFDDYFERNLIRFFKTENSNAKFTTHRIKKRTLGDTYKSYIQSKGFHGGYGKVGSLFDFLVWKTEIDTTYKIDLINDTVSVNVTFMTEFISLGWEEYATFGKSYPGGWTTSSALYCVKESYDMSSENFNISYLKHEGQHFSDKKNYPKLGGTDLEYRAKLVELIYANNSLYSILEAFLYSAKNDKNNAHPYAAYCLIREMSTLFFNNDFENDWKKWEQIPKADINSAAKQLFIKNTDKLNSSGKDVVSLINQTL